MPDSTIVEVDTSSHLIKDLFSSAKSEGGIDYIYTLVRVTGIESGLDPLVELQENLQDFAADGVSQEELRLYLYFGRIH